MNTKVNNTSDQVPFTFLIWIAGLGTALCIYFGIAGSTALFLVTVGVTFLIKNLQSWLLLIIGWGGFLQFYNHTRWELLTKVPAKHARWSHRLLLLFQCVAELGFGILFIRFGLMN